MNCTLYVVLHFTNHFGNKSLSMQWCICNFLKLVFRHVDTHLCYTLVFPRGDKDMFLRTIPPVTLFLYGIEHRHFHTGGYSHSIGSNYLRYSRRQYTEGESDVSDSTIRTPPPGAWEIGTRLWRSKVSSLLFFLWLIDLKKAKVNIPYSILKIISYLLYFLVVFIFCYYNAGKAFED